MVSDVLGIPVEAVDADISPDNTESWDSMSHLNLVLALEAEFQLSLTPEDAMEMLSVGLIRTVLSEYGVTAAR